LENVRGERMKHTSLTIFTLSITLVYSLLPIASIGAERTNYVTYKQGLYSVESDDLRESDTKYYGELSVGHYFGPYLSMELGIGYLDTEGTLRESDPILGSLEGSIEITAVPITLTAKGFYPFRFFPIKKGELYAGAGAGLYFVHGEANLSDSIGLVDVSIDDNDITYGYHFELGANVNLTSVVFFGISGKYLRAEADFKGRTSSGVPIEFDAELNRYIIIANIGLRF